jgi:hypothetical protein
MNSAGEGLARRAMDEVWDWNEEIGNWELGAWVRKGRATMINTDPMDMDIPSGLKPSLQFDNATLVMKITICYLPVF